MEQIINEIYPDTEGNNYELIGPDERVILSLVWEEIIEPDWVITMRMRVLPTSSSSEPALHPLSADTQGSAQAELAEGTVVIKVTVNKVKRMFSSNKEVFVFTDDAGTERKIEKSQWRRSTIMHDGRVKDCVVFTEGGKNYASVGG